VPLFLKKRKNWILVQRFWKLDGTNKMGMREEMEKEDELMN